MRPDRRHASRPRAAGGLVLIAMLIFIALSSFAALAAADVWSLAVQREREAELLFVGNQYRRAIESYWNASPGPAKALPTSLRQLLEDDRFPQPVRHLRRAYADPMTGEDFAVVTSGPAIVGVHSRSSDAPVKRAQFPDLYAHFEAAATYQQWRFVFTPPRPGQQRTAPPRGVR